MLLIESQFLIMLSWVRRQHMLFCFFGSLYSQYLDKRTYLKREEEKWDVCRSHRASTMLTVDRKHISSANKYLNVNNRGTMSDTVGQGVNK